MFILARDVYLTRRHEWLCGHPKSVHEARHATFCQELLGTAINCEAQQVRDIPSIWGVATRFRGHDHQSPR